MDSMGDNRPPADCTVSNYTADFGSVSRLQSRERERLFAAIAIIEIPLPITSISCGAGGNACREFFLAPENPSGFPPSRDPCSSDFARVSAICHSLVLSARVSAFPGRAENNSAFRVRNLIDFILVEFASRQVARGIARCA